MSKPRAAPQQCPLQKAQVRNGQRHCQNPSPCSRAPLGSLAPTHHCDSLLQRSLQPLAPPPHLPALLHPIAPWPGDQHQMPPARSWSGCGTRQSPPSLAHPHHVSCALHGSPAPREPSRGVRPPAQATWSLPPPWLSRSHIGGALPAPRTPQPSAVPCHGSRGSILTEPSRRRSGQPGSRRAAARAHPGGLGWLWEQGRRETAGCAGRKDGAGQPHPFGSPFLGFKGSICVSSCRQLGHCRGVARPLAVARAWPGLWAVPGVG